MLAVQQGDVGTYSGALWDTCCCCANPYGSDKLSQAKKVGGAIKCVQCSCVMCWGQLYCRGRALLKLSTLATDMSVCFFCVFTRRACLR